ncbi:MAG: hypothetical protein WBL65_05115 [Bryobacteraceae bacterium]|jgi:hypothetical protein
MKLSSKTQQNIERHIAVEQLVLHVLELLLEYRGLDEYWFGLNQRDLRPEAILRDGRVSGSVVSHLVDEFGARGVRL